MMMMHPHLYQNRTMRRKMKQKMRKRTRRNLRIPKKSSRRVSLLFSELQSISSVSIMYAHRSDCGSAFDELYNSISRAGKEYG
jgi:hypothetical protein